MLADFLIGLVVSQILLQKLRLDGPPHQSIRNHPHLGARHVQSLPGERWDTWQAADPPFRLDSKLTNDIHIDFVSRDVQPICARKRVLSTFLLHPRKDTKGLAHGI